MEISLRSTTRVCAAAMRTLENLPPREREARREEEKERTRSVLQEYDADTMLRLPAQRCFEIYPDVMDLGTLTRTQNADD